MGEKVFLLRDADVSGKKLLGVAGLVGVGAMGTVERAGCEQRRGAQPRPFLPGLTG